MSRTKTRRWTAGREWPVPEGGKDRLAVLAMPVDHQEAVRQHNQRQVALESVPSTALIMVEAALAFGVFVELLDGPTHVGQMDKPIE